MSSEVTLKPGDFVKLTRHLSMGHLIAGQGSVLFIISIPDEFDDTAIERSQDALVLFDERLIRVPDWWLRKNSVVLVG